MNGELELCTCSHTKDSHYGERTIERDGAGRPTGLIVMRYFLCLVAFCTECRGWNPKPR